MMKEVSIKFFSESSAPCENLNKQTVVALRLYACFGKRVIADFNNRLRAYLHAKRCKSSANGIKVTIGVFL